VPLSVVMICVRNFWSMTFEGSKISASRSSRRSFPSRIF
jgi:hypothetical protein